jgi:predicted transcriptional regulator
MASAMDEMKEGMQRTARRPSEAQRELVRRMREFQNQLSDVEREQQSLAAQTGEVKAQYREEVAKRLQAAEAEVKRLEALSNEALRHVERAEPGVTPRSENDFMQARDRLSSLSRALAARDLDAALETVRQATPAVERFAGGLEEDVAILDRYPEAAGQSDPDALRAGRRSAAQAVEPAREVRRALEKVFPDPSSVLGAESQARLQQQSQQQDQLAQRAEQLREQLADLSQSAPIFPPEAAGELGASREHMRAASGELSRRDPMRGNGEQRQALEALRRFREGMEENAQQGGGGAAGEEFPYPMAAAEMDGGVEEGEGLQAAHEKVEIPGAEAFKPPEEFRRELLDAMKEGAPEPYRSELQRYYQEIVR